MLSFSHPLGCVSGSSIDSEREDYRGPDQLEEQGWSRRLPVQGRSANKLVRTLCRFELGMRECALQATLQVFSLPLSLEVGPRERPGRHRRRLSTCPRDVGKKVRWTSGAQPDPKLFAVLSVASHPAPEVLTCPLLSSPVFQCPSTVSPVVISTCVSPPPPRLASWVQNLLIPSLRAAQVYFVPHRTLICEQVRLEGESVSDLAGKEAEGV